MTPFPAGPHGNEMDGLIAWLQFHQEVLLTKIEGLNDEQVRRPGVASGTNLLGLVKHLAYAHARWFQVCIAGEQQTIPVIPRHEEFAARHDESVAELVALYRSECERAIRIARASDPNDLTKGSHPSGKWDAGSFDVRWVLLHMLEELARHNGHADILREQIDSSVL